MRGISISFAVIYNEFLQVSVPSHFPVSSEFPFLNEREKKQQKQNQRRTIYASTSTECPVECALCQAKKTPEELKDLHVSPPFFFRGKRLLLIKIRISDWSNRNNRNF